MSAFKEHHKTILTTLLAFGIAVVFCILVGRAVARACGDGMANGKEGFRTEFTNTDNIERDIALSHSSYAQQTNHLQPHKAIPAMDGMGRRVNAYHAGADYPLSPY